MKLRSGLRTKFLLLMTLALVVLLLTMALMLKRQEQMQGEVVEITRDAMAGVIDNSLNRRGEGMVNQLAESLTNPLYYFDLDAMGELTASALRQPDARYVLVYDEDGVIIHDGSEAISSYGKRMDDGFANDVIMSDGLLTLFDDSLMDVSTPIMIGDERLGGVRMGFDLEVSQGFQERAVQDMRERLAVLGHRQVVGVGLVAGCLLLMGIGMLWLVQRWLVRPIRHLADSARQIEAGRFDLDLPTSRRRDEVGELLRAFSRMSESVARHDRDIRRMAYTDALTGLSNRLAFREALDEQLLQMRGEGQQLALLFADIDDFKRVNDTLGHDAGDDVLVQCSARIRDVIAREAGDDALLARFGGDEFVILVRALPRDDGPGVREIATQLAERLVVELGQPLIVQDRQVFLGTSIGITLFPDDASTAASLMKNGDIAMYQAKVAGKNCFRFYSRAMDLAVERRVNLEHELRGAWERGELSLVYQPVYRLSDRTMVGAEALLRWNHPKHGQVAPSVFIDVAEQSGLIESLGPRVLHAACSEAVRWQQMLPGREPLTVAVNVSPRQLRGGGALAEVVASCLKETGLEAGRLHLELTETAVIGDEAHVGEELARLRETGVKVLLDDFGTGFSGLSHLRRVPVDGVKIDRSFIADILRDPDDLALTSAIIAMAHSLGITVIAEGVEKAGQYALLRERGCDQAQGYWLGSPMPGPEFLALLKEEGR
ncbi:EAL domain-containing protein [Lysobacter sp. SG-8]|uniref:EAL domain-containing protein n=1 Tax=Marilutibacter penaei TaxID=2759900 RepID=A0A7W3U5S4_9GAMM|nr:GGDEF domain-containing phosphodiesterase [Lysobacter penaei]MBB1089436.1 EAL domain-containing protein [Lysobacter penaei]